MTNREYRFMAALQRADSHDMTFDGRRLFEDGREMRAMYDALVAIAHGIDATNEKLDGLRTMGGSETRDAIVTVYREVRKFERLDIDGNTPVLRTVTEIEKVPAKVWPVCMGEHELLVEFEDGRLGIARLGDIELEKKEE